MKKKDPELRSGEETRSDADEARKRILARRASFVAAALAGVSTACGKEPAQPPQPCLSPVLVVEDAGPEPCLSPMPPEQLPSDAGAPVDAGSVMPDAVGAGAPPDAAAPVPCLRAAAPPGGPRPQDRRWRQAHAPSAAVPEDRSAEGPVNDDAQRVALVVALERDEQ